MARRAYRTAGTKRMWLPSSKVRRGAVTHSQCEDLPNQLESLLAESAELNDPRCYTSGDTAATVFAPHAGWPGFREVRLSRERGSGSSRGFGFVVRPALCHICVA